MIGASVTALALALTCVVSVISLIAFYVVGGPFGQINDIGNALVGLLSAALAFILVRDAGGWGGVAAAVVGAALTAWGSWLVMSGSTGFVLAGFVSAAGFGFIGLWLALVAWSPPARDWWSRALVLVRITAMVMVLGGVGGVVGAIARIDAFEDMPGWLWLFSLGWLGVYALYPIVALILGRRLLA